MPAMQANQNPLMQAIIALRESGETKEEQAAQLFFAFALYIGSWLDCDSKEQVESSLKYGLSICERHGQCMCGHDMSEGHLRHGNVWIPPRPTALAEAWTEQDQSEAYAQGWLLLVGRDDRPFICPVHGADVETNPAMAESRVRDQAENGDPLSAKAVAILDR